MSKIQKAKEFAQQLHKGHKRLSGESYAEHTLRVFKKLKKHNIREENTLMGALLHHTLDYPSETEKEIEKAFGKDTLALVKRYKRVSDTKIETNSPKGFNEKYLIQTYINLSKDMRVVAIRLADKADNLEHSWALPKEKRLYNAEKALYLYSPLARIAGMSRLAVELENEAFKILNPQEYYNIQKDIAIKKPEYEKLIKEVNAFLRSILAEHGIKNSKIQGRVKHLYGIYRKIIYFETRRKEDGVSYNEILDTIAFRIIVNTVEDCYLVENLLKELWDYLPKERDDYIKTPRASGYKSIHNIFKVKKGILAEVQIRTFKMHEQNEYGLSSHLLYKINEKGHSSKAADEFKKYLKDKPLWFKDLNFWEVEKTLSHYKPKTPFSKNVYVFTPKGDIIELPRGATPLDFAYEIHSKLGNSCVGAFVNGKIVKLDQQLRNGDLVEIKPLKSKTKPSRDWLKMVKTKKAKTAIRKSLE